MNDDPGRLTNFVFFSCFLFGWWKFWLLLLLLLLFGGGGGGGGGGVVVVVLKLRKSKWFQHCLKRCLLKLPKHVGGLGLK